MLWLDETTILVAVHFSMNNIYQSCDLGRAVMRSNVDVSSLFTTFAWRWLRITIKLNARDPPPGCSKTSVRQYLILNIIKLSKLGVE